MQPFTADLARRRLPAPAGPVRIGSATYQAEFTETSGFVIEDGPAGTVRHPILHVLGGKNVFCFLTSTDRGRLQVLPIACEPARKEWFDIAASSLRHFQGIEERPLDWRDPLYTFNSSCLSCHTSQPSVNYDPQSDTYRTTWAEPGVNCETCHGPAGEHLQLARQLPAGQPMSDSRVINPRRFGPEQHNDSCASCHAKVTAITQAFQPGGRFFDHFDLITLESPDYYPDGRDLGENYTYTSWRMSRCVPTGRLHCLHCHTTSGHFRFRDGPNQACLPCHQERVANAPAHTHHLPDSTGSRCVSCHMPTTTFARMTRSDHSMRPPMPSATLAFGSPNACTLCHADRDSAWADRYVRQWHAEDYQAVTLRLGTLIAEARRRNWSGLPDMLRCITSGQSQEIFAVSLIRLLEACADQRKWPALIQAMKDPSPLVRSAAAAGLAGHHAPDAIAALLVAAADPCRLVRFRAAEALAGYPLSQLDDAARQRLQSAWRELEALLRTRPYDWASQYNLGNFLMDRGQLQQAVEAFQAASRLRPDVIAPWVNAAIVQARLGQLELAERSLTKALELQPDNAAANLNLGLLKAETGDRKQAERFLRAALRADPSLAQAAYSLAVLLSTDRLPEAIQWCTRARELQPDEPRYGYALGLYLNQAGKHSQAKEALQTVIRQHPDYLDAYALLGQIHEAAGQHDQAAQVYRQALSRQNLSPADQVRFQNRLDLLEQHLPPQDRR